MGDCHNIFINEDSKFAYAVGCDQRTTGCKGGLNMIDVSDLLNPKDVGCYSADRYTHGKV